MARAIGAQIPQRQDINIMFWAVQDPSQAVSAITMADRKHRLLKNEIKYAFR
jgi:hypothetical protein